jgi:outer membrane immunogenic protein
MKRLILAGIGALAVVTTMGAANAADMPRRAAAMPAKAPYMAPYYNWTGFYAGINGGYGWGTSSWDGTLGSSGSFNVSGAVIGGTLGYNWQFNQAVFGVEGDLDWSNIKGSTTAGACALAGPCETRNNWLGTVRGRIGYAFDRVMPFVTGGLAVGDIKSTLGTSGSTTTTKAGWTLGGGAEFAVAGPWTAKVEYLYADLGKGTCATAICGASTDVKFHTNLVRGGLNYRF